MFRYLKTLTCVYIVCCWFALTGCGQKGDLYLPEIPQAPDTLSLKQAPEYDEKAIDSDEQTTKKQIENTNRLSTEDSN